MNTPPASPEHHPIRTGPTKEERHAYNSDRGRPGTDQRLHAAGRQLCDADCALHTAHQTYVDVWIAAADRKLAESRETDLGAGSALRRRIGPSVAAPASPGRPPRPDRPRPAPRPGWMRRPKPDRTSPGPGVRLSYSGHLVQCCCARRPYRFTQPRASPSSAAGGPAGTPAPEPRSSRLNDSCPSMPSRRAGSLPCPQRPHPRRTGHPPEQPAGGSPPRSWPARCRWPVSGSREARPRPRRASP